MMTNTITAEERHHLLGITRLLYAARGDSRSLAEARCAISKAHDIVVAALKGRGVDGCEIDALLEEIDEQVDSEYETWKRAETDVDFDDWAFDMAGVA